MWIDYSKIDDWQMVKEIVVGGLEWIGFSKVDTSKLLCISSQMTSLIDCCSGEFIQCDCDYDEELQIAYCDKLPDEEIEIAGQYGGKLPSNSIQGDKIGIKTSENFITTVTFSSVQGDESIIFQNYGFYTCGFSYDGKYFVFAQDAGISLLKRV